MTSSWCAAPGLLLPLHKHYSTWASWRRKSPPTRPFVQYLVSIVTQLPSWQIMADFEILASWKFYCFTKYITLSNSEKYIPMITQYRCICFPWPSNVSRSLTHWALVTLTCIKNSVSLGLGNGLKFKHFLIERKMHLEMVVRCWPFWLGTQCVMALGGHGSVVYEGHSGRLVTH